MPSDPASKEISALSRYLNTVLLAMVLAIGAWSLQAINGIQQSVAAFQVSLASADKENEGQSKDLLELRARVTALEIEVAQLKARLARQ